MRLYGREGDLARGDIVGELAIGEGWLGGLFVALDQKLPYRHLRTEQVLNLN